MQIRTFLSLVFLSLIPVVAACDPSEQDDDGGETDTADDEPLPECEVGFLCPALGTGVAGPGEDGKAPLETELYLPQDVAFGPGGEMYVVDWNNHRIRRSKDEVVETIIGTGELGDAPDGEGTDVAFNHPTHVAVDPSGGLVISAWHNSKVMYWDPDTGEVSTLCGNGMRKFGGDGGPAKEATLDLPAATAFAPDGGLYIVDQASQRVRYVDEDDVIQTVVGNGTPGFDGDGGPATLAELHLPVGQAAAPAGRIAVDRDGNLFIADTMNHRVRKVDTEGVISTYAGTGHVGWDGDGGPAEDAELYMPVDLEVDDEGNLYIADTGNACIRRVDPEGIIDTLVGICGRKGDRGFQVLAVDALLNRPYGIALGPDRQLFIADTHNHRIVKTILE